MKKITKLLVVGLLSLVMVFSAAACSGTPTDTTGLEGQLEEISTVLDALKLQAGANVEAINEVEAAIKAGDTNAALEALAEAVAGTSDADAKLAAKEAAAAIYESQVARLEAQAILKGNTSSAVTAKGYTIVHNAYPAVASVSVSIANGIITASNLKMTEIFYPGPLATKNEPTDSTAATYGWRWSLNATGADATAKAATVAAIPMVGDAAKYVAIGTRVFENTGATVTISSSFTGSTMTRPTPVYKQIAGDNLPGTTQKVTDLVTAITKYASVRQWYVDALTGTNDMTAFKILTTTTGAATYTIGDVKLVDSGVTAANSSNKGSKEEGIYWNSANYPLGWLGNVAAMEAVLCDYLNVSPHRFTQSAHGEWQLGGVVNTGATLTDFQDYLALSQAAYINALLEIINPTSAT